MYISSHPPIAVSIPFKLTNHNKVFTSHALIAVSLPFKLTNHNNAITSHTPIAVSTPSKLTNHNKVFTSHAPIAVSIPFKLTNHNKVFTSHAPIAVSIPFKLINHKKAFTSHPPIAVSIPFKLTSPKSVLLHILISCKSTKWFLVILFYVSIPWKISYLCFIETTSVQVFNAGSYLIWKRNGFVYSEEYFLWWEIWNHLQIYIYVNIDQVLKR